jgi:hypothetical protein
MNLEQAKAFIAAYLLIQKPSDLDRTKFKMALQIVATIRRPE